MIRGRGVVLCRPGPVDVAAVAAWLRADDRAEIAAAHGIDADDIVVRQRLLAASVACSADAWVALRVSDGAPVALLGCSVLSLLTGTAAPWLLGTEDMTAHRRDLLVLGSHLVRRWGVEWPVLRNWVDARNTAAVQWLRRLGFHVEHARPHGPLGVEFYPFSLVRVP